jgi:hypothetical protein
MSCAGTETALSPNADLDLLDLHTAHRIGKVRNSSMTVTEDGITAAFVGERGAAIVKADLDGDILQTTPLSGTVLSSVYETLVCSDGSVWFESGPKSLLNGSPAGGTETLENYDRDGKLLRSTRLFAWYHLIAANKDTIFFLDGGVPFPNREFVHFGFARESGFLEEGKVRLTNPVRSAIGTVGNDARVLIIERPTGNMTIVDKTQQESSQFGLNEPHVIHAVAENGNQVYLLSGDNVFKTDLGGHIVQSYWLRSGHRFVGRSVGVTSRAIYVMDRAGRIEIFPFRRGGP